MGPLAANSARNDFVVRESWEGGGVSATSKALLSSHLGPAKDGPEDKFSLGPVSDRLSELLGKPVSMAPDCIGDGVKAIVDGMSNGDVTHLENVRFYKEET